MERKEGEKELKQWSITGMHNVLGLIPGTVTPHPHLENHILFLKHCFLF